VKSGSPGFDDPINSGLQLLDNELLDNRLPAQEFVGID
jgi:hypothetical protein